MAAEYLANAVQSVTAGSPAIFTASIPCTKGYVYHEDETGIFILRGITCGQCYATYQVTFNGNIAIPTGETIAPISVAVAVNGEARPTRRSICRTRISSSIGSHKEETAMGKLHQLREMLCEELEEYGTHDSIDMHGLQTVDMLAHALKNLDKIIESDGGGYDDYSRRGRRRDSMGRYSATDLRSLMDRTSDERTRGEIQRMLDRMD